VFFDRDIKGDLLPPRTLCLTYDDGPSEPPGPDTRELGHFLYGQGVPATFFAVGRHAAACPGLVRELREWGHLVGNHTWSHPGLVSLALSGGDVVGELERADAVLGAPARGGVVYVRAPYGNWRETEGPGGPDKPASLVAGLLNASRRFPRHVGPVNWDVCAEDWECWRRGLSPEEAAGRYLAEAERLGRGIVLMHDSSEDEHARRRNRTVQMTRILVPALERRGYRFVRLDRVPQVRSAARVVCQIDLATGEGRPLSFGRLGVVPLRGGRVALRMGDGRFICVRGGRVAAGRPAVGRHAAFTLCRCRDDRVAFRTEEERYLSSRAGSDRPTAHARRCGTAERFSIQELIGDLPRPSTLPTGPGRLPAVANRLDGRGPRP
jgi:peptidoglycan/xylan/chitin deacetylase (PgdA/CDA1 family)